jgi:MFS transporter, PAT family, beta-lactamase induction signal transducer AmpG
MISKMSQLFYRDSVAAGGLAIPTETIGIINGVTGVGGIILGGMAGAWFISRRGLRRTFLLLVLSMAMPNLLYVWAALVHPPAWSIFVLAFIDQFGYGFGFAGYIIYLIDVAQRNNRPTSHAAIGSGLGALTAVLAGITAGILQQSFGYVGLFVAATVAAVPGLLTLWFIPMDNEQTRHIRPVTD